MARIRSIKPEYWTSEQVMECSIAARLLFIGIWNYADDDGRMVLSAKRIKAQVFPSDDLTSSDVRRMIDELAENGLIEIYVVEDKEYLWVTGWRHQRIDRPYKSVLPPAPGDRSANDRRTFDAGRDKDKEGRKNRARRGSDSAPSPASAPAHVREAPQARSLNGAHPPEDEDLDGADPLDEDDAGAAAPGFDPADPPGDDQPGQTVPCRASGDDQAGAQARAAAPPEIIEHSHATYDRVLARIHAAVPSAPISPAVSPIVRLMAQGFDLEDEIIPACIDALNGKRRVFSWEIVAERVQERITRQRALRERDGLAPKPQRSTGPKLTIPGAGDYDEAFLRDCVRRWRQDPGSWFAFLGPKPNEAGCHIPRRLIEASRKAA